MSIRSQSKLILMAAAIFCGLPAQAAWCVKPDRSKLEFSATWEGTEIGGEFRHFVPHIQFDPADLSSSNFEVDIDVTSAHTGSRDRDQGLAEADWFDFNQFPAARFRTVSFDRLGNSQYVARGQLELKGVKRPVAINFSWKTIAGGALLEGSAKLNRLDFGIGQGEWASDDIIGLAVRVSFDVEVEDCAGS